MIGVGAMGMLVRAVLVGLAYLAAARQAVVLHDVSGLGAVFWPGAGITVTGLLLSPRRWWPAIVLAVGAAELGNDLWSGFEVVPSLWWSVANMIEGLLAAWLIQRWRAAGFDTVRAIAWFFVAAFVAASVGAVIGAVGTTGALGTASTVTDLPYVVTVGQWMIGDGLGILTVVPLGLLLFGRISAQPLRSLEGLLAILVVLASSVVVFGLGARSEVLAADYVVLLPLVWVATRMRVAGAAVGLFIVAQVANVATPLGRGPFTGWAPATVEASVQAQLFLVAVSATALLLACRSAERADLQDLAVAREHLIAAVSHELRTPLTAIVGFSETLMQRPDLDEASARQAAEVIHRNGVHLTALVDDLLRTSRARRGVTSRPERIELEPWLGDLLASRPDEPVERSVSPGVHVFADPTHLHQIVSNLLDNAARHGRPPVHVEVTASDGYVEISVTDHGDGVPPEFAPILFDEFSQASTGDQRTTTGLGLGLSLARELARADRGDLVLRPGTGGACFVVTLPQEPQDPSVTGAEARVGIGPVGDA